MISPIFQLLPGYGNSDEEEGNAGGGGPEMIGMDGVVPGGGGGGVTAGCSVSDMGGRAKILFQLATLQLQLVIILLTQSRNYF